MPKTIKELWSDISEYMQEAEQESFDDVILSGENPDNHILSIVHEFDGMLFHQLGKIESALAEVESFLLSIDHRELVDDLVIKVKSLREELR